MMKTIRIAAFVLVSTAMLASTGCYHRHRNDYPPAPQEHRDNHDHHQPPPDHDHQAPDHDHQPPNQDQQPH